MSVKDDKTPIYRCPVCFSPLFLDDEENGIWRCTNDECLKVREVIVKIETFNISARWAWQDEQELKIPYRRGKGHGHSGKRHKAKKRKPVRWYQVDRSVTERGRQARNTAQTSEGSDSENPNHGSGGEDNSERGSEEALGIGVGAEMKSADLDPHP